MQFFTYNNVNNTRNSLFLDFLLKLQEFLLKLKECFQKLKEFSPKLNKIGAKTQGTGGSSPQSPLGFRPKKSLFYAFYGVANEL